MAPSNSEHIDLNNKHGEVTEVPLEPKVGKVTFGTAVEVQLTEINTYSYSDSEEENDDYTDKLKAYVIIDVGGERFQANRYSLMKYPDTRLGKLMNATSLEEILFHCEEYIPGNPPEYFFDKNPENFPSVMEMYRSGNFHIPDSGRGDL